MSLLAIYILTTLIHLISGLSIPSTLSILQSPSTNISDLPQVNSTSPVGLSPWPIAPYLYTYNGGSSEDYIGFIEYGRVLEPSFTVQTQLLSCFDDIILNIMKGPEIYDLQPRTYNSGWVTLNVELIILGVRSTKLAIMVQQLRDLMHERYGPSEILMAEFGIAATSQLRGAFAVRFPMV